MTMEKKTHRPLSTTKARPVLTVATCTPIVLDSCVIQSCIRQTATRATIAHQGNYTMKKPIKVITFSPDTVAKLTNAFANTQEAIISACGESVDTDKEVSVRTIAHSIRIVASLKCSTAVLNTCLASTKQGKSALDVACDMNVTQAEVNAKQRDSSNASKAKNKAKSESKALQDAKDTIFNLTASPLEKAQRAFDEAFDMELGLEISLKQASIARMKARVALAHCEINGGTKKADIERLKLMIADIEDKLKELEA